MGKPSATSNVTIIPTETGKNIQAGHPQIYARAMVAIPQIGLMVGTCAMLGAGIALLLSEKLTGEQRRAIGWTLIAVGALTTIPLAVQLLGADE